MPYIGRAPSKSGAFRILDDISSGFNGSTVAFTLQSSSSNITPGTEQNLLIAVDGVMQEPVDAFTISGSTITFTSAPASGASFWGVELGDVGGVAQTVANDVVTNANLANMAANTVKVRDANSSGDASDKAVADTQILIGDGTGFTAAALSGDVTMANTGAVTIANNAVENAMMADDSIGVAELNTTSGTASSSTFLRGDMQWQAAGGGSLTLINTETASNSATLTVTGLSTTYDSYLISLSDIVPADNKDLRFMMGDSGGIDDGNSDYEHVTQLITSTSTNYNSIADSSHGFIPLSADVGNDAGDGLSALLVLNNANSSTMRPTISGTVSYLTDSENVIGGTVLGQRKAVIAVTQVQVKFSTGNIVRGRMTVWGLAHA